jgi:hypothetical protein
MHTTVPLGKINFQTFNSSPAATKLGQRGHYTSVITAFEGRGPKQFVCRAVCAKKMRHQAPS